jgi:hypothetical protein
VRARAVARIWLSKPKIEKGNPRAEGQEHGETWHTLGAAYRSRGEGTGGSGDGQETRGRGIRSSTGGKLPSEKITIFAEDGIERPSLSRLGRMKAMPPAWPKFACV